MVSVVVTPGNTTWRMFTYKELHTATKGFRDDNKLGEGGFGSVYWGKTSDGLQVFVYNIILILAFGFGLIFLYSAAVGKAFGS